MAQRSRKSAPAGTANSVTVPADGLTERIPIVDVWPQVACGRRPAAAALGETIPISATVFRDGHAPLSVEVHAGPVSNSKADVSSVAPMTPSPEGVDRWTGSITVDEMGPWWFTIHAWSEPWLG